MLEISRIVIPVRFSVRYDKGAVEKILTTPEPRGVTRLYKSSIGRRFSPLTLLSNNRAIVGGSYRAVRYHEVNKLE